MPKKKKPAPKTAITPEQKRQLADIYRTFRRVYSKTKGKKGKPSSLADLLESTHFYDPDWPDLDTLPPQADGRPGWDTPESIGDESDE
jgi:hypothetical protein